MNASDRVFELLKKWQPEPQLRELKYRDSLVSFLREKLSKKATVSPEFRHLGNAIDIHVKQDGLLGSSEVFIEMKLNLRYHGQLNNLIGQVESLKPKRNRVIVILCGETNPTLLARLKEHYGVRDDFTYHGDSRLRIFEKTHSPAELSALRRANAIPAPRTEKHRQVRELVETQKRRIRETNITNLLFRELHTFREIFLKYDLADRSKPNRDFFDDWLADPVVVMGWTPAGGWTRERVIKLHTALDTVKA